MGATRKQRNPSGYWKFLVLNVKEREVLAADVQQSSLAEIAHNVSSKNCRATVGGAAQLAISITDPNDRLHSEEKQWPDCGHIVFVLIKP